MAHYVLNKTQREVLKRLTTGMMVKDVARDMGINISSVSRAISTVQTKAAGILEDVNFLIEVGYFRLKGGVLEVAVEGGDPKLIRGI